jgi:hypothetical protein
MPVGYIPLWGHLPDAAAERGIRSSYARVYSASAPPRPFRESMTHTPTVIVAIVYTKNPIIFLPPAYRPAGLQLVSRNLSLLIERRQSRSPVQRHPRHGENFSDGESGSFVDHFGSIGGASSGFSVYGAPIGGGAPLIRRFRFLAIS